jgi:hypothetical protein
MNYLEKEAKGATKRLLEIIGLRKKSVLNRLKDTGSKAVDNTKSFYNKNKTKIQYGGGGLALGAGAYAGGSALANRKNKQVKKASYYELGHELLEKDAGPKIDNVKKSLSSFWRNKIKHNFNSGKTYIKGKGDKWFGKAKDGETRFDKGVRGVRKASPYVVGGAAGVGGTALYNKYKNRDQE